MDILNEVTFVIQARLNSSRLPAKVLLHFAGTTVLGYLIGRLRDAGVASENIIVATTNTGRDDVLATYVEEQGITVVRGDERNVLSRYQLAAERVRTGNIVRLTSDNPCPDLDLVRYCHEKHSAGTFDLTTTRFIDAEGAITRYVPKGLSIDILSRAALIGLDSVSCTEFDREHVIPYYFRHGKVQVIDDYQCQSPELSIDTIDDYVRVKKYVENQVPNQHDKSG